MWISCGWDSFKDAAEIFTNFPVSFKVSTSFAPQSVAPYENGKPIYSEFTSCPAAEFAIRHGLTDIMPALCNVDYASMELLHARLVRTTTCVDGCRCDYTICGDKDPYLKEHPEYRDEAGFRRNK